MIFAVKNHEIEWKYKDFEQNFVQEDQGCSLISSGTRWLKKNSFFLKSSNKSQHCQQNFIHHLRRNYFEVFFQKHLYSWSFSEDEPKFLKTLEKKLWKFVETALYALGRKNWWKNFFWKIWNFYFSSRFWDKKFKTGLCEFHSTCTEEQFGKKCIVKKFINFQNFRTVIQNFSDYSTKMIWQGCQNCFPLVYRSFCEEEFSVVKKTKNLSGFLRVWAQILRILTTVPLAGKKKQIKKVEIVL